MSFLFGKKPVLHDSPGIVVVSPQYALNQQITFVLAEQTGAFRNDDFTVTDEHGRPYFVVKAALVSAHNRRTLVDANTGQALLTLSKKAISLHGTWVIEAPDGRKLAECKPSLSPISSSISVYLKDGDSKADFTVKGNFSAKKFNIIQHTNGGDATVASVKKEGKFSSVTAFVRSKLTDSSRYYVTVEAGVDVAFIAALATLVDEVYHDDPPKPESPRAAAAPAQH